MKKLFLFLSILSALPLSSKLFGQSTFYDIDVIQEIKIYFERPDWDSVLDSLYVDGNDGRTLATVEVNGSVFDSVGIRYKGFSSVSTDRTKNPFNIKLDYLISGQEYEGIDKIKLGNIIQDPSFIREALSYEISRKYMPASMCNYVNVYINDTLWGLYSNVQSVNKDFVTEYFGSGNNSFFKCNPENLDFSGENSNLGNSPGTDTTSYLPFYDMRSDNGWSDLYDLIYELNENTSNVESLLNVDRTLWMHALNYSLVNFDSYIGYGQNYYLYQNDNSRFQPILWDLNMSFASFRFSDASEFYNGFTIEEAKTVDPLSHLYSVSVYPRPLMRNLFENETWKKMYLAHMRTIVEENFSNQDYSIRGQYIQNTIDASVASDSNKFYSYQDFQQNLTTTVSDLIDYPGIMELMDARATYLSTYEGFLGAPVLSNISTLPSSINMGDDLTVTVDISDASEVYLSYRFGKGDEFTTVMMLDDGNQNDGLPNDGTFGGIIPNVGNIVHYYVYSQNDSAGRFSPERAAYEYYSLQVSLSPMDLVINEFMASNDVSVADPNGEFDDWIEIHNNTSNSVSTAGLFLSDDSTMIEKWSFPDLTIGPNGYLIVWADGDTGQEGIHTNFKLSSGGDKIILSNQNGIILDSMSFGIQETDVAVGRYPDGTGPFMVLPTTFGYKNSLSGVSLNETIETNSLKLYPNPANNYILVDMPATEAGTIELRDNLGKLLYTFPKRKDQNHFGFETSNMPNGIYHLQAVCPNRIQSSKFIVRH